MISRAGPSLERGLLQVSLQEDGSLVDGDGENFDYPLESDLSLSPRRLTHSIEISNLGKRMMKWGAFIFIVNAIPASIIARHAFNQENGVQLGIAITIDIFSMFGLFSTYRSFSSVVKHTLQASQLGGELDEQSDGPVSSDDRRKEHFGKVFGVSQRTAVMNIYLLSLITVSGATMFVRSLYRGDSPMVLVGASMIDFFSGASILMTRIFLAKMLTHERCKRNMDVYGSPGAAALEVDAEFPLDLDQEGLETVR